MTYITTIIPPFEHRPLPSAAFTPRRTVARVKQLICDYYDIKPSDLLGPKRRASISHPRQVAMYLARVECKRSYPDIGDRFRRDHSTVIYAVRTVEKRMADDPYYQDEIEFLKRRLCQ